MTNKTRRRQLAALGAAAVFTVAACGTSPEPTTTTQAPAPASNESAPSLHSSWKVAPWNNATPAEEITFQIGADGVIAGSTGCNHFTADYVTAETTDGGIQLQASNVVTTDAHCGDAMEQEEAFLEALAEGFEVTWDETQMVWRADGLELAVTPNPAADRGNDRADRDPDTPVVSGPWANPWFTEEMAGLWLLKSMTVDGVEGQAGGSGWQITLEVSADGFGGRVCNSYGAAVSDYEDGEPWPVFRTLMACVDDAVMTAEDTYLAALDRAASTRIADGELIIEGDGVELRYQRVGEAGVDVPGGVEPGFEGETPRDPFAVYPEELRRAIVDLAGHLGVAVSEVKVVDAHAETWRDGSLGCPQAGVTYTQATVDGYQLTLAVGEVTYHYHGVDGRDPFLCE